MNTELSRFGTRNNNKMNSEFSSQIQLKSTEELFKPERRCPKIVKVLLLVLVILIAIAIGFVLGYFLFRSKKEESRAKKSSEEYLQEFKDMIDPKELENNLRCVYIVNFIILKILLPPAMKEKANPG